MLLLQSFPAWICSVCCSTFSSPPLPSTYIPRGANDPSAMQQVWWMGHFVNEVLRGIRRDVHATIISYKCSGNIRLEYHSWLWNLPRFRFIIEMALGRSQCFDAASIFLMYKTELPDWIWTGTWKYCIIFIKCTGLRIF